MRTLLAASVAALLLVPAAASGASLDWRALGTATTPPQTVDRVTVAWGTDSGAELSPDDEVPGPRQIAAPVCAPIPGATPDAPPLLGALAAAGGGALLWSCGPASSEPWPLVQPLGEPAARPVPGAEGPGWAHGDGFASLVALGSQWIVVGTRRYPGPYSPAWLNWRTGEWRYEARPDGTTFDLSSPELFEPLCAPLTGHSTGLTVRGRYAASTSLDGFRGGGTVLPDVTVRRCGKRRPVLHADCEIACTSVSFGPRGLVWVDGARVRAWRPGMRRATTIARVDGFAVRVVQTEERLVLGVQAGVDGPWALTAAPMPYVGRR